MKPDIADAPPSPAFVNAPPCSTSWDEKLAADENGDPTVPPAYGQQLLPYATCGYTPSQLQGAYGTKSAIAGGLDGHGQTVAIVDAFASPTIAGDANQYASLHGQPAMDFSQVLPEDRSNDPIGGRTSATRRAGTARRPSTSRPCTRWHLAPTSSSSAAPIASTSRSSTVVSLARWRSSCPRVSSC
jgi:hypothetical protein